MYNAIQLKAGFENLIGWRQNTNPNGLQLEDLLDSTTGIYFNDLHSLLTFDNLESIMPNFEVITYPGYDSSKTYYIGQMININDVLYRCTAKTTGNIAPNTSYWEVYKSITSWLKEKTEAALILAIDDWMDMKMDRKSAVNLMKHNTIFERYPFLTSSTAGTAVYKITPRQGLATSINDFYLHFEDAQTIEFKLYEIGNPTAIQTKSVEYTDGEVVQKVTIDWDLSYKAAYYLQYTYSGKSIDYDYIEVNDSKMVGIGTVKSDNTIDQLWNSIYSPTSNYGLNIHISAKCDYTDFLIEQKELFKTVYSLKVAIQMLRELAINPHSRINTNESNISRDSVLYELDGNNEFNKGLVGKYEKALKTIMLDRKGINSLCLPCKKNGFKIGSV